MTKSQKILYLIDELIGQALISDEKKAFIFDIQHVERIPPEEASKILHDITKRFPEFVSNLSPSTDMSSGRKQSGLTLKNIIASEYRRPMNPGSPLYVYDEFIIDTSVSKLEELKKIFPSTMKGEAEGMEDTETKPVIFFSEKKGFYRNIGREKLKYPISGMRNDLIVELCKEETNTRNLCDKVFNHNDRNQLAKEIKAINLVFSKYLQTSISIPIIIHIDTNGYELNHEAYDIRWIK